MEDDTGSPPIAATIGIVVVAALVTRPDPPPATKTFTWCRTSSAASSGNRS
jgi:hypothetical protein